MTMCLYADCCYSELHYKNPTKSVGLVLLKINLFSPWYSWKIAELALSDNHSLTYSRNYIPCISVSIDIAWHRVLYRMTSWCGVLEWSMEWYFGIRVSEWLYFNANSAIFQLFYGENKLISTRWWLGPLCTRPTRWVGFL